MIIQGVDLKLLWILLVLSDQVLWSTSQDGFVQEVQTASNVSLQVDPSLDISSRRPVDGDNVASKVDETVIEEIHSSFEDLSIVQEEPANKDISQSEPTVQFQHQHVNIATELSESGQAAVVFTLVDSATSELQKQAAVSTVSSDPDNSTGPVTIPLTLSDAPPNDSDTQYIVRAAPRQEPQVPISTPLQEEEEVMEVVPEMLEETNDTLPMPQTLPEPPPQEDIPSFSEWAQKQLAEAEKKKGDNVTGGNNVAPGSLKVRHSKNYASPDCGAKVVASNPEAVSAGSVLSSSRDEYLLNTCNARIWFIVELCEAIQPKKVEMANFELFSSSPRELTVWLSDRYPTRDWALAGRFTAQDERSVQAFNLSDTTHFGKYVKVEVHSHYGQEHYCPVSLFRVYGTSEIEVLDTVEEGSHQGAVEDDDDDLLIGDGGEAPKNLFGSARDAVLSIVKKAAEALAKTPEEGKGNTTSPINQTKTTTEHCVSPSHIVVCVNCSDDFYNNMYQSMSCRSRSLQELLMSTFVRQTVVNSEFCAERGLDLRLGAPYPSRPVPGDKSRPIHYLQAFLPAETLAALCNLLAVEQKKVVLNISYEQTTTDNDILVDPPSVEDMTPLLPETPGACTVDSNTSEESPGFATRPPHEPPQHTSLPIRPSRTLREEEAADSGQDFNTTHADSNVTVEEADTSPPVVNDSANNLSIQVEKATAETMQLVVEDSVSLDSLFSELEQAVVPSPRVPPAPQKESVFVRLANRIKALERNMSLSGQYLEELSRRYKRQVEEMQRALAGAVDERRRGEEREGLRLEQVAQLSQQVEALTAAVKGLLEERDSWQLKTTVVGQHGVLMIVEVLVFAVVFYACRWLPDVEMARRKFSVAWPRAGTVTRRKSVDELMPHAPPSAKKRRPSEEALVIAGSTHQELLIPEARRKISKGETRRQRRKRKRELATQQVQVNTDENSSLLDRNSSESVAAWWEEEVLAPMCSAPAPTRSDLAVSTAPRFLQTAVAQRQERVARSNSEHSDKDSKTFLPVKKSGPFKKIVKKFF